MKRGLRAYFATAIVVGASLLGGVSHAQWVVRPGLAPLAASAQREGEAVLASLDDYGNISFFILNDTCELSIAAATDRTGRTNVQLSHTGRVEQMSVTFSGAYLEFRSSAPLETVLSGGYGPEVTRRNRYGFRAPTRSDPSRFITLFNQMVQACQATR